VRRLPVSSYSFKMNISVIKRDAMCYSVLQCVSSHSHGFRILFESIGETQRGGRMPYDDKHCNTCDTLQHTATHCNTPQHTATHCDTMQHTETHCNILQHAFETQRGRGMRYDDSVLQCVAVCCSVLQCVAVCCSVSQCVAVCCSVLHAS